MSGLDEARLGGRITQVAPERPWLGWHVSAALKSYPGAHTDAEAQARAFCTPARQKRARGQARRADRLPHVHSGAQQPGPQPADRGARVLPSAPKEGCRPRPDRDGCLSSPAGPPPAATSSAARAWGGVRSEGCGGGGGRMPCRCIRSTFLWCRRPLK
jgi:hypothetical protein